MTMKGRLGYYVIVGLCVICLMGCSAYGDHSIGAHPSEEFNRKAYSWRYRNLDSTIYYATKAYEEADRYSHGRTVACNMFGFVAYMQMQYDVALYWYDEVDRLAGCELERFVADVGRMNVYLRTADNLSFYNYRVKAMERLAHISEETDFFSIQERVRLFSTVNDFYMVTALHHYMIGQRPEARVEMDKIVDDDNLRTDSAQWLMVQYLKGLGLDVEGDTYEQRVLRRYTYLNTCLRTGREGGYSYFEGIALSGLAELLADSLRRDYLSHQRPNSFSQLFNGIEEGVLGLAYDARECLHVYGDCYGVVNTTVQIASICNREGKYEAALDTLSVLVDGAIMSVPDALCRLHEESSLAYAGLGDKAMSDYHRNQYLDLLETTRQDKELESRYLSLKRQQRTMTILLCVVLVGIALLGILIVSLSKRRRMNGHGYGQQLRDLLQETEKRVFLQQRHVEVGKRGNVVRKATFSMLTGVMPYIDRMAHEVDCLQYADVWNDTELRTRKMEYISELADEINCLNEVLSQWIKTTQGVVSLHVESFSLAEVFEMIERSSTTFLMKGLTLEIQSTDAVVKADKALTFFMLNTLADNARKFTPEGGIVRITADVCDDYVELSVRDTGAGMSETDIAHVLCEKVYDASSIGCDLPLEQRKNKGGGFGLLNCKGIIEKYRKTDSVFDVCRLGIDSRIGKGSRFWFRLPKGVRRLTVILCVMIASPYLAQGGELAADSTIGYTDSSLNDITRAISLDMDEADYSPLLVQASAYADSVYYANVDGRYEDALSFADSAIHYLNVHHCQYADEYIAPLTAMRGEESNVELRWWLSDFSTDYHTILDVRNELAVANLALRRWDHYRYNNRIYNDLYKLISEDRSLIDYCNRMQRYNSNISLAIFICVLLVLGYVAVLIYTFMGRMEHVYSNIETIEDEERRTRYEGNRLHVQNMVLDNCLSTIKHETVYYPNRIKQLVARLDGYDERLQMKELIDYYRVVFTTLTNCALRQLEEVTFRRSEVEVEALLQRVALYHAKLVRQNHDAPELVVESNKEQVLCDVDLIDFLLEQLIDAAIAVSPTDYLTLQTNTDGEFVRFTLVNTSRTPSIETIKNLFSPSSMRHGNVKEYRLKGSEYMICRQIIREHDDYFNHVGCRITAELISGGYTIWFTLPRRCVPLP